MITTDDQVLVLLCSHLGLTKHGDLAPLTLREWNALARRLHARGLRPSALLGWCVGDFERELGLRVDDSLRLTALLERYNALAKLLERLESRGIYVLTRASAEYPQRYRDRLGEFAPVVLFYAGERTLLWQSGIAVVGSRHPDQTGQECAEFLGTACASSHMVLYSGGARGVDTLSMTASLRAGGTAVGVLANGLEKAVRDYEALLRHGNLCLVTPYSPSAGFSIGAAMGRNRLIYCLADYAIVVTCRAEQGGTWAGAIEALKHGWIPVFVLEYPNMPAGNRLLLQKGALPLPYPLAVSTPNLPAWLRDQSRSSGRSKRPRQLSLI